MKSRVNFNSIEAFKELNLSPRQEEVYNAIKSTGQITAKGVGYMLSLSINQITGRINELMHLNLIKIEKTVKDKTSKRSRVNQYCVRKETDPLNIFDESWEDRYNSLNDWVRENYPNILHEYLVIEKHEL